ncbi:hypothetical protein B9G98_03087 [Wickerhamiella sorbophila]|uniref:Jacalin-type lectin domain-containing protein n=1 Tax=Wickerhamiella sorbophila TaxID=45607 RepID=A0A2T0FKH5_9ASCO|nr:hypothetical protein B9G98_03087 [Wickerhamiella sorbophila]PRT55467.1 hypothetical protein B9G98_03087 [Wickerhamiella sorbophila]
MKRSSGSLPDGINFVNVWDNAMISARMVIVHGQVRNSPEGPGSVVVYFPDFPAQRFPSMHGYFKALVHLEKGENILKFEAEGPNGHRSTDTLRLRYQPIERNPPVHFCLLVAKDSPLTFDAPEYKIKTEGNSIDTAVRKLRLASYMMSAFTMEQMNRNDMGLRTFRPYEENEPDTVSNRDRNDKRMTTHIHIVRMDKTLADIRHPDVAQQNSKATRANDLFSWAGDALKKYGGPFSANFSQAACIYLDTHWDPSRQLVLGHAALGGNVNNIQLAIFGGHTLNAWPTCIEDIPRAFLDETRTDTRVIANDANQSGSAWEACNIGQGAFMHEIGHLLGCPHEPSGVMLRGYLNWNRSFMAIEGFNVRENRKRLEIVSSKDEDYWHRLDIMRFRFHLAFALPGEPKQERCSKPALFPTTNGFSAACPTGIYMVDIHCDGTSRGHIEFMDCPTEIMLTNEDLAQAIEPQHRQKPFEIHVHGRHMEQSNISNLQTFTQSAKAGKDVRSGVAGREAGNLVEVKLPSKPLSQVTVFSGDALDGMEFTYSDGQSVLFGKKGGSPHVYKANGDSLVGLSVRAGYWVDAGGVVLSGGRTAITGGPGGGVIDLIPPRGYRLTGVFGYFESWCQGIGVLYQP